MKLLKSIICCLAVSMAFTSCNDWLDVNDDPHSRRATTGSTLTMTLIPHRQNMQKSNSCCRGASIM